VNAIDLSQITDVEHSFVMPIVFSVAQSVDAESGNLNEAAIARVKWIIARAKKCSARSIDIDQFQSKYVSASETERCNSARTATQQGIPRPGIRQEA